MNNAPTPCRSCGSSRLDVVLDLGNTPIANALVPMDAEGTDPVFPLAIALCSNCALAQLTHDLPSDVIFDETYQYFSSFSDSLLEHSRIHSSGLIDSRSLDNRSFVVEVASNDGYLLRNFVHKGIPVLGIEPSPKPARAAREVGVETREAFLTEETGNAVRDEYGPADVVIANNVMAHVPDINDFFKGMKALVADQGIVSVENPQLRTLVDGVLFDTIYHEHYSYLSCTSVQALANRHDMYLNHVEPFPGLHGGTLRWVMSRSPEQSETAKRFLAEEAEIGLGSVGYFEQFATKVEHVQTSLKAMLQALKGEGKTIAAYGCAAKGATLLNTSGIGVDLVDFVVDRNPEKQGQRMPGCRVPCYDVAALVERRPDVTVILAWNFADEIVQQQSAYRASGGRFIIPVPEPHLL